MDSQLVQDFVGAAKGRRPGSSRNDHLQASTAAPQGGATATKGAKGATGAGSKSSKGGSKGAAKGSKGSKGSPGSKGGRGGKRR
ncbi:hypothetical protein ACFFX0_17435 [Citricoccus parietis]|uniref:Uncharacterized protein n=1 Tax=Citricoccus parietis TaxID=592307 RepID=A0ABV5G1S6_9MICC